MKHKTSALVEGAIFAAIAIVFNLLFYYVPVIGLFINLVMPLPIAICGMRNGVKWAVLSAVVATAIVAMLVNPIHALFFIGVYGIMGVVLGECMHRHFRPAKLVFVASAGALIGIAVNMLLALYVMGINPVQMMFTSLDDSVPQMLAMMRDSGMDEATLSQWSGQFTQSIGMMKIILPGAMLLSAPLIVMLNYWVARKILSKLGESFDEFPPFKNWTLPRWLVVLYFIGIVGIQYFGATLPKDSWQYMLTANLWAITSILLVLQGVALVYWYFETHNKPKLWFNIILFVAFLIPVFSMIMTYVGAYDLIFDFRKLRK